MRSDACLALLLQLQGRRTTQFLLHIGLISEALSMAYTSALQPMSCTASRARLYREGSTLARGCVWRATANEVSMYTHARDSNAFRLPCSSSGTHPRCESRH